MLRRNLLTSLARVAWLAALERTPKDIASGDTFVDIVKQE